MDKPIDLVSPRGFAYFQRSTQVSVDAKTEVSDPEITHLYRMLKNRDVKSHVWTYRKRVIENAVRLLKPFHLWATLQYNCPYLYGRNIEFLTDTLDYLRTGKRKLTVRSWLELVEEFPPAAGAFHGRKIDFTKFPTLEGGVSVENIITLWCSRPGGFEDMLFTLYLMYGEAEHKAPKT